MSKLGNGQVSLCEEMLRNIPDVVSARVTLSPENTASSVQVLAGAERSAAEVAADVVAVMKKYFAVDVKPEMVTVAHLQEPPQTDNTMSIERRPRFAGLNISSKGNQVEIKVEIANEGTVVNGIAVGPSSTRNRQRLIAQATLIALGNWIQGGHTFILEDLTVASLAGKRVALVAVSLLSPMGEEFLTGSAVVDEEEADAIIRATLDAVNRRLSVLTG
ncbi:MAG: hypothetical protein AB1510_04855 [Bacillota bacterium]